MSDEKYMDNYISLVICPLNLKLYEQFNENYLKSFIEIYYKFFTLKSYIRKKQKFLLSSVKGMNNNFFLFSENQKELEEKIKDMGLFYYFKYIHILAFSFQFFPDKLKMINFIDSFNKCFNYYTLSNTNVNTDEISAYEAMKEIILSQGTLQVTSKSHSATIKKWIESTSSEMNLNQITIKLFNLIKLIRNNSNLNLEIMLFIFTLITESQKTNIFMYIGLKLVLKLMSKLTFKEIADIKECEIIYKLYIISDEKIYIPFKNEVY